MTTKLSPRELECLTRAAHGATSKAIAAEMGVTRHTVRNHNDVAYKKLGVHCQVEAFLALGWLTPPNNPREETPK